MAKQLRTNDVNLRIESGSFTGFFKRLSGRQKAYNFSDISTLRKLLSNERARLLETIKNKKPTSIYHLAKILGRDFKSVRQDVKLLERFGFIELDSITKGRREMLKPLVVIDRLNISIDI